MQITLISLASLGAAAFVGIKSTKKFPQNQWVPIAMGAGAGAIAGLVLNKLDPYGQAEGAISGAISGILPRRRSRYNGIQARPFNRRYR